MKRTIKRQKLERELETLRANSDNPFLNKLYIRFQTEYLRRYGCDYRPRVE